MPSTLPVDSSRIVARLAAGDLTDATTLQINTLLSAPINVKDYGAVGDGVTDDTSAITNTESAVIDADGLISKPSGTYLLSGLASEGSITKNYTGPGKLQTADGHQRANNVIRMLNKPSGPFLSGGSIVTDFDNEFLSPYNTEVLVSGNDTVGDPATGYFQSAQVAPFYTRAFFNSGKNNAPVGDGGRTGWGVYDTRISHAGQGDGVGFGFSVTMTEADNRPHVVIKGTNGAGTFVLEETVTGGTSGATGTVKSIDVQGGDTILAMDPTTGTFALAENVSGGTSSATATNLSYVGPTDSSGSPGGVFYNGTLFAAVDNVGLNGGEIHFQDGGFDISVMGILRDLQRTNNTAARQEFWDGMRLQSTGTESCDNAHQIVGPWTWGIDMTGATFDTAAISLKAGQEIHFNETSKKKILRPGFHLSPDTPSGTKMYYDSASSSIAFEVAGTPVLDVNSAQIELLNNAKVTGDINITGNYRRLGAQLLTARQTGYTNAMTGTADRATSYDTSTITLQQLAERVKAIQDDLTAHGLIGV